MQCMYLWNVIKRFRETEMIVALNNSQFSGLGKDWAEIFSLFLFLFIQLIQQQCGPNFTQFWPPTSSSRQKLTFYIAIYPFPRDPLWTFHWPLPSSSCPHSHWMTPSSDDIIKLARSGNFRINVWSRRIAQNMNEKISQNRVFRPFLKTSLNHIIYTVMFKSLKNITMAKIAEFCPKYYINVSFCFRKLIAK